MTPARKLSWGLSFALFIVYDCYIYPIHTNTLPRILAAIGICTIADWLVLAIAAIISAWNDMR